MYKFLQKLKRIQETRSQKFKRIVKSILIDMINGLIILYRAYMYATFAMVKILFGWALALFICIAIIALIYGNTRDWAMHKFGQVYLYILCLQGLVQYITCCYTAYIARKIQEQIEFEEWFKDSMLKAIRKQQSNDLGRNNDQNVDT